MDSARYGIQTLAPALFDGAEPDFVVSGPNVGCTYRNSAHGAWYLTKNLCSKHRVDRPEVRDCVRHDDASGSVHTHTDRTEALLLKLR